MRKDEMVEYNGKDLDCLEIYNSEIDAIGLISDEEAQELIKRIRKGDEEAKVKLIESNLRLVRFIAKKYKGKGLPVEDLIQEGNIALINAVNNYNPERGVKFSAYAFECIKLYLRRSIALLSNQVKKPVHVINNFNKYNAAVYELAKEFMREPTVYEISEKLGYSLKEIDEFEKMRQTTISANSPVGEDEESEIIDLVSDPEVDVENSVINKVLQEDIVFLFNNSYLSQIEKIVLYYRMGFDGGEILTLDEIGKMFNITRQRVKQIQDRAIQKLISSKYICGMEDYSLNPDNYRILSKILNGDAAYDIASDKKNNRLYKLNTYSNKEKRFLLKVRNYMSNELYFEYLEVIDRTKNSLMGNLKIEDLSILVLSMGFVNNICYKNGEISRMLDIDYEIVCIRARRIVEMYHNVIDQYIREEKPKTIK